MLKFMRSRRAFTLVEILVAVAILALLAAIAVPVVLHLRANSEDTAKKTELSDVQSAVDNLMTHEAIETLLNRVPSSAPTQDMSQFPDWNAGTSSGWVLYPVGANPGHNTDKYLRTQTTAQSYWCEADGTIHQV